MRRIYFKEYKSYRSYSYTETPKRIEGLHTLLDKTWNIFLVISKHSDIIQCYQASSHRFFLIKINEMSEFLHIRTSNISSSCFFYENQLETIDCTTDRNQT